MEPYADSPPTISHAPVLEEHEDVRDPVANGAGNGMYASIYTRAAGFFNTIWNFLTGTKEPQPQQSQQAQQIKAVQTTPAGNKRRGVTVEMTDAEIAVALSKMPGSFSVATSPKAQLPTPPTSRPTTSDGEKHDSPMATEPSPKPAPTSSPKSSPVCQEQADHQTASVPISENNVDNPITGWRSIRRRREFRQKMDRNNGRIPTPETIEDEPEPMPSPAKPVTRNAQRDSELAKRLKKVHISIDSPQKQEVTKSWNERKQQKRDAEEAAKQKVRDAEEAVKQKAEFEEAARQQLIEGAEAALQREQEEAEAALQREQEEAVKQRIIRELPSQWKERVDSAMATANTSKKLATVDGVELSRHDLGCLLPQDKIDSPDGWLNDEIVNAWFTAIVAAKAEQAGARASQGPYVAYSSAWWTSYQRGGMSSISRWSKRYWKKDPSKLLQCEKVFLPINTGAHWTLLVISPKNRIIEYFDSMGGPKGRFFKIAREWLLMELGEKYVGVDWTDLDSRSAFQSNSNDCGCFVCFNGLMNAKGDQCYEMLGREGYSIGMGRRLMAAILLNGGFAGEWML